MTYSMPSGEDSRDGVRVGKGSHTPKLKILNEIQQHSASSTKTTN